MSNTLVIDTGEDIIGIYSVEHATYDAYRGTEMLHVALPRILQADEIVTYNGAASDLIDLGSIAALPSNEPIRLRGTHSDMREICWSARIWGECLEATYLRHYSELPPFPETYEGSNERDVFMTFKLWEKWRIGQLKVVDGRYQR